MSLNTILATAPLTTTNYVIKATGTALGNSIIYDNGTNVGIGNTNTSYTLDVSGTGRFTGALTTDYLTANSGALINTTSSPFILFNSSGGGNAKRFALNMTNGDYMKIYSLNDNGTTRTDNILTATIGGNVGIGTSSPQAISGYVGLTLNGTDGSFSYYRVNTTNIGRFLADGANFYMDNLSTSGSLIFTTNNTTERMRITSGGVTQITGQLSVTAAGGSNAASISNGSSGYGLYVGAGSGSNWNLYVASSAGVVNMYVAPNGYGFLLGSAWAYGSDIRMKENISDVQNGMEMVLKIKPKHFDYIDGQKNNIGFIAQDIQEIIPQAVSISNEETGMLALKTDFLVPYLVKAIQEMNTKSEEQQALITSLQEQINELKNK